MFSLPPRRCATAHAKSTDPKGSPKIDAHAGALGLARGGPEPTAIDAELAPSRLTVRCHPKVSESRSPCCHDAVGEDLVEFHEPERR
jgi:hypothetical protein